MVASRLGVDLELQLPVYTIASATLELSCVCNVHHQLMAMPDPNPLNKARDRTPIFMNTSWIRSPCATMGTPTELLKVLGRNGVPDGANLL